MRQEVKNDKVLRAIAVGIAAMMATSAMPATVLANENPEAPDTPTEAPEASGGSQESESSSASQQSAESTEQSAVQTASASEMQEAVVTLGGETTEASGLITTAVEQTASIGDAMVTENVTGAQAVFEGVDGAAGVAQQLDGAKAILDDAANKEAIADVLINTADETVDALNTQTSNYQTADEKATQNADSAIGNANTANTSDSEQEAYAARDAAIENLGLVEEGFEEANIAYTNALSKAEDAELEYEAAEKEHQLALAKVEEAKAKLLEAQMNSTAALEMLKAAEQRAGSLERRAEELQETSEQLNAAVNDIKKLVQSSTDKSYNRVQKMISQLQKAGIQNPTFEQAQKMLAQQDQSQSANQPTEQGEAQPPAQQTVSNPEAAEWIRNSGGDPAQDFWFDIYDAAKEAGVDIIVREDPEYSKYFEVNGQLKQFEKPRQFVRAFEQAFAEKAARLHQPNMASSPAIGSGGGKSNFRDPKSTSGISLISAGLRE